MKKDRYIYRQKLDQAGFRRFSVRWNDYGIYVRSLIHKFSGGANGTGVINDAKRCARLFTPKGREIDRFERDSDKDLVGVFKVSDPRSPCKTHRNPPDGHDEQPTHANKQMTNPPSGGPDSTQGGVYGD